MLIIESSWLLHATALGGGGRGGRFAEMVAEGLWKVLSVLAPPADEDKMVILNRDPLQILVSESGRNRVWGLWGWGEFKKRAIIHRSAVAKPARSGHKNCKNLATTYLGEFGSLLSHFRGTYV